MTLTTYQLNELSKLNAAGLRDLARSAYGAWLAAEAVARERGDRSSEAEHDAYEYLLDLTYWWKRNRPLSTYHDGVADAYREVEQRQDANRRAVESMAKR